MFKKKEETDSWAHTRWNCKYHIVFAPKYRRQIIYGQIKADVGSIIRKLCEYKGVEILEAEACPDHIHLLVSIPPKYSVSQFMGYLKGKSSLMIFDRHANLKYKYGNRQFGCKGYYVDTVGRNNAYTGLNLPHAREKPATSPENFRHLAGEGCQCKRETTYCEEHTKNV